MPYSRSVLVIHFKYSSVYMLILIPCKSFPVFGSIWAFPLPLGILNFLKDTYYWGVFHSLSWVLIRPLQSESSCASILYYFLDNFLPTIFSLPYSGSPSDGINLLD